MMYRLCFQFFLKNKNKTAALLASIIVGTVLFFSINTIRESGYESQIKESRNINGSYDISFDNIKISDIDKLGGEGNISKMAYAQKLNPSIYREAGIKLSKYQYSKEYIDSLKYKLVGSYPKNENEIIIEKKAIDNMKIDNPIGKEITLLEIDKKIINNKNIMDSADKKYRIVGYLTKSTKYYDDITVSTGGVKFKAFTGGDNRGKSSIYDGVIFLKDSENVTQYIETLQSKLKMGWDNIRQNDFISSIEMLKLRSKYQVESIISMVLLLFVSMLIVYNIFNIIISEMSSEIGTLRSFGMSRKQTKKFIKSYLSLFWIVGTTVGILLGILCSFIGIKFVYKENAQLAIKPIFILIAFIMNVITLYISYLLLNKKVVKRTIVELIDDSKDNSALNKSKMVKLVRNANIKYKIVWSNILRRKSRTVVTIFTIALVGYMFILNFSSSEFLTESINRGVSGGIWGMSYGTVDKALSGSINGTDSLFYTIDDDVMEKIHQYKDVDKVEPSFYSNDAFLVDNDRNINVKYKKMYELNDINLEYPLAVRGYSDKMLQDRKSFISKGKNIVGNNSGDIHCLFVNNVYSKADGNFNLNVLKRISVGDKLKIKIPSVDNKLANLTEVEVTVSGIMDKKYASSQDGSVGVRGGQIIIREDDYKKITGAEKYNKVFITTKNGDVNGLNDFLEKTLLDNYVTSIGGKGEDMKFFGSYLKSEARLNIVYQVLILILATVNFIFIMRSNLINRREEVKIYRYIGMTKKVRQKIDFIEALYYGIISALISSILASIYHVNKVININKDLIASGFTKTMGVGIPLNQIILIFLVYVFMSLIAVLFSWDIVREEW